jgi:hypothetical protein
MSQTSNSQTAQEKVKEQQESKKVSQKKKRKMGKKASTGPNERTN